MVTGLLLLMPEIVPWKVTVLELLTAVRPAAAVVLVPEAVVLILAVPALGGEVLGVPPIKVTMVS